MNNLLAIHVWYGQNGTSQSGHLVRRAYITQVYATGEVERYTRRLEGRETLDLPEGVAVFVGAADGGVLDFEGFLEGKHYRDASPEQLAAQKAAIQAIQAHTAQMETD